MNIKASGRAAVLLLAAASSSTARADSPELGNAKALYAQASYEDALVQLNRITDADDVANQVDQYRALCLLALGRDSEAQASLERLVVRAPLYVVKVDDTSPKLVTLFQQVRTRTLPVAARDLYAKARVNFDAKRFREARPQFEGLLAVLNEAGADASASPLADLRQLGEGFLTLTMAELTPVAPAPTAVPPPAAVPEAPAKVPVFYVAEDADVVPPVEVVRDLPPWNPPSQLAGTRFSGILQIDLDEFGHVERALVVQSVTPSYDSRLVAAAKTWRFQPATKDGISVKYRKNISVVLEPSRPSR
jgi:TonB family protein